VTRSFVGASLAALALMASGSNDASGASGSVDRLTLEEQVGQLIVLSFAGMTPPAYVVEALHEGRAAGVILFGGNIASPAQLRELTAMLRRSGANPVVAVDQEGGSVRRLPWAPPALSESEQLRHGIVRSAAEAAASPRLPSATRFAAGALAVSPPPRSTSRVSAAPARTPTRGA
jgi:hypothetical protein